MSTSPLHLVRTPGWTIIVPVKALGGAKSRLSPTLSARDRRRLVVAMATDVIGTCLSTPSVTRVRVVSSDREVETLALRLGAEFVAESRTGPNADTLDSGDARPNSDDALNNALSLAFADVSGPVGVVTADLPELGASHLEQILSAAEGYPHSIVVDRTGAGTTMAFWTDSSVARTPRFGQGSADRHRTAGGAVTIDGVVAPEAASRDVDNPDDLAGLTGRPVGEATAGVLREGLTKQDTPAGTVCATMVP